MKTAVKWVFVFVATGWTEGKVDHRGKRAVIRQGADDREAGATVGAIDKGVTVAPIVRVEEFAQTVITKGDIGRNEGTPALICLAFHNDKGGGPGWWNGVDRDRLNVRQRRRGGEQRLVKSRYRCRCTFDLDKDASAVIADKASQAKLGGKAIDKGAKADPLDNAGYAQSLALSGWIEEGGKLLTVLVHAQS
jgi:hypothetical protein